MLAASITPRKEINELLIAIDPNKQPPQNIGIRLPIVERDENPLVISFDDPRE